MILNALLPMFQLQLCRLEELSMVLSLRKWVERMKFVVLFLSLTFVIYHLLHVLALWFSPQIRFGEPNGRAIKAYATQDAVNPGAGFGDRLRFFYWYGE